jgi:O-antigen/teichoic acid export membrane protein
MLRNIGSNWALSLLQIIVLMQLTPIQVNALGEGANGAWLTVASLTGVLGLLILGVPMASVRFIAQHVASKDLQKINQAVASCLGICLFLGIGAIGVGAGLSVFFERTYLQSAEWQSLGPRWLEQARIAYWISVLQVGFGFAAQLPFGVLEAHHAFVARNGVGIVVLALRFVLTVGLLYYYPSLVVIALVQVVGMTVEFLGGLLLIRRHCPGVRFGLRGFDRQKVMHILGFSVFVMLLTVGNQIAFRSDALVIGAFLDPAQGTFFDVGNKFFPPLTGIVLGIGAVVMPLAAKLQATGDVEQLKHAFLKWSKISYSLALLVGAYLLVVGPEFVAWWMGPGFGGTSGPIVQVLMASFLFFLPVRGVALPILMGLGKPVKPALALLGMAIVNLAVSLLLVKPLGIFGVALGTALPCVGFAVAVALFACRELGVSGRAYLAYVAFRPTLGVLPAMLFLLWLKLVLRVFPQGVSRTAGVVPLVLAGLGMVVLFAISWVIFVYRGDPYFDLQSKVERFFPASLRRKTQ